MSPRSGRRSEEGDQPSRFVDELGVGTDFRSRRPARPLSLVGVVGELRRVAADPAVSEAVRRAAAARLARLRAERAGDRPLVATADPATWWGLRPRTEAVQPVRPGDAPVKLTASALGSIEECALRWFLAREAGGESVRSSALGFGSLLHVLAEHWSRDTIDDVDTLIAHLDSVWDQLRFDGDWKSERERLGAHEAIRRFVAWHEAARGRSFIAAEAGFAATLDVDTERGPDQVRLEGRVDRLERAADGSVVVVDFKTGKSPSRVMDLPTHPQLGAYQAAVEAGGFPDAVGERARSGGAELVHLRQDSRGLPRVQVQHPQIPDDVGRRPVDVQIGSAVSIIRAERFDATINGHCNVCEFETMCPAFRSGGVV